MSKLSFIILILVLASSGCARTPVKKESPLPANAYDAELSQFPYPWPVQTFAFEGQRTALEMRYMDVRPEVFNGETVVLLHGKNFSAAYWEPTIRLLLAEGYRVVAPDQIGFGKSTKPDHYQFSFHGLARHTHDLLESLGIGKVTIVGHSMGGMLAARYTLMYPDAVRNLILVNPIGLEDWKTVVPYRTVQENYEQELRATPESIREYQRVNYFDGKWKPEYESLIEMQAGWTRHPDYPRIAWNSALTSDMVFTQPVLYEFPLIRVPTLLIIGTRDRTAIGKAAAPEAVRRTLGNYEKLGKRASRAIPKARLVEFSGVGHLPQVEAFSDYRRELLRFLKRD